MAHYKMSDVVTEVNERENNPANSKYERFVGLEHYVSGEVVIRNYGSTERLESTMKVFQAGDILVARRNVYLKRASTVDFDGLTSGDSIVLRAKDPEIGKILPFVLNTDAFWDFADQYSDGTMSKRLSPKTLMTFEFDLPDGEELSKLADILWAANDTRESYQALLKQADELVKSQFIELFGDPIKNPFGWETTGLLAIGDCKNGMNFGSNEQGVNVRCVGVGDVKDRSRIDDLNEITLLSLNQMPAKEYLLQDGDIVFVRSNGNKNLVGRCVSVYPHDIPLTFSGFCIRFRKKSNKVLISYLLQLFKQQSVRAKLVGRGANIQNLNQKMLAALEIPVPPMRLQEEYRAFIEQLDKSKYVAFQLTLFLNKFVKYELQSLFQEECICSPKM